MRYAAHGSDDLKRIYLPKLISGRMDGHDAAHRAAGRLRRRRVAHKAERASDGTYRISGQKIFITYGEHELTDNIIHLVLGARCRTRRQAHAAYLFSLCRNFWSMQTAAAGARNDAARIPSSTRWAFTPRLPARWSAATMAAPSRYLVGEENRGMSVYVHDDEPRTASPSARRASASPKPQRSRP